MKAKLGSTFIPLRDQTLLLCWEKRGGVALNENWVFLLKIYVVCACILFLLKRVGGSYWGLSVCVLILLEVCLQHQIHLLGQSLHQTGYRTLDITAHDWHRFAQRYLLNVAMDLSEISNSPRSRFHPLPLDALIHSDPALDNLRFVDALKISLCQGKSAGASDVFKSSCGFAVRALRDVFEVDISVL